MATFSDDTTTATSDVTRTYVTVSRNLFLSQLLQFGSQTSGTHRSRVMLPKYTVFVPALVFIGYGLWQVKSYLESSHGMDTAQEDTKCTVNATTPVENNIKNCAVHMNTPAVIPSTKIKTSKLLAQAYEKKIKESKKDISEEASVRNNMRHEHEEKNNQMTEEISIEKSKSKSLKAFMAEEMPHQPGKASNTIHSPL